MPLFTVLIPTYNRAALLAKALDSVTSQEFRDFEVVVVDDGSTDETQALLAGYVVRSGVRSFRQENQGQSLARNHGIREARGEYVAFLDSDDIWFPWTLASIAQAIEFGRPAAVATPTLEFPDGPEPGPETVKQAPFAAVRYPDLLAYFQTEAPACFAASALVVRTDVLRAAGGFPNNRNNSEDIDLCLRLGTADGFVAVRSPVCVGKRAHAGNISHQVRSSAEGLGMVFAQERAGNYPGGALRRAARMRLITFISRAVSVQAISADRPDLGWRLYRACLPWHLSLGRLRYLLGFPLLALRYAARRSTGPHAPPPAGGRLPT